LSGLVQAQANLLINATLAGTAAQATTGIKTRLMSVAGSTTAAGTELTGTGYTTLGTVTTWNSAASAASSNITVLTWTNGSGSSWTIAATELWDQAGTPVRWWEGAFTGGSITVSTANVFSIAAGALIPSIAST
jgi:hypothetical protein